MESKSGVPVETEMTSVRIYGNGIGSSIGIVLGQMCNYIP